MKKDDKSKEKPRKIPNKMILRQSLFWDVDAKDIDLEKDARYVIERIMDLGMDDEVKWMRRQYSKEKLRDVAEKSRALSPQSKNLWLLLTKK